MDDQKWWMLLLLIVGDEKVCFCVIEFDVGLNIIVLKIKVEW